MEFGQTIRNIRENKGMKAVFVARKIGMSPAGYGGIELGKVKVSLERAKQIADVLGVDMSIFFRPEVGETLNAETATQQEEAV